MSLPFPRGCLRSWGRTQCWGLGNTLLTAHHWSLGHTSVLTHPWASSWLLQPRGSVAFILGLGQGWIMGEAVSHLVGSPLWAVPSPRSSFFHQVGYSLFSLREIFASFFPLFPLSRVQGTMSSWASGDTDSDSFRSKPVRRINEVGLLKQREDVRTLGNWRIIESLKPLKVNLAYTHTHTHLSLEPSV